MLNKNQLGGRCYPEALEGVTIALAFVDGLIAFLALYKVIRIHSRNSQLGWTHQKVFHLLIGSCNLGEHYKLFVYLLSQRFQFDTILNALYMAASLQLLQELSFS